MQQSKKSQKALAASKKGTEGDRGHSPSVLHLLLMVFLLYVGFALVCYFLYQLHRLVWIP